MFNYILLTTLLQLSVTLFIFIYWIIFYIYLLIYWIPITLRVGKRKRPLLVSLLDIFISYKWMLLYLLYFKPNLLLIFLLLINIRYLKEQIITTQIIFTKVLILGSLFKILKIMICVSQLKLFLTYFPLTIFCIYFELLLFVKKYLTWSIWFIHISIFF